MRWELDSSALISLENSSKFHLENFIDFIMQKLSNYFIFLLDTLGCCDAVLALNLAVQTHSIV